MLIKQYKCKLLLWSEWTATALFTHGFLFGAKTMHVLFKLVWMIWNSNISLQSEWSQRGYTGDHRYHKYFGLVIFTSSFTQSNKQNSLQQNDLSLTIYSCSVNVLVKIGDFTSTRNHCEQRLYGKPTGSGLNRAAARCTDGSWSAHCKPFVFLWFLSPLCREAVCLFYGDKNLCFNYCLSQKHYSWEFANVILCCIYLHLDIHRAVPTLYIHS